MIADKTKAALQSCLCHYEKPKQIKHTRVNADGQNFTQLNFEGADFIGFFSQRNSAPTDFTQLLWQSPKVSFAYNSLIPAFFLTLGKKGGKSNPTLCFLFLQSDYRVSQIRALTIQYVEYAVATKKTTAMASRHLPRSVSGINHSSGSALAFLRWSSLSFLRNDSSGNCIDSAFDSASTGCEFFCSFVMCQPLGSMPRCCSFSRQASLTHELNWPFPAAALICSNKSSSNRMCFIVLPERSKFFFVLDGCIGSYHWCKVYLDGNYHLNVKQLKITKPAGATNTNGPLTKPLVEVIVMAGSQHTQTHPKFTWRFLSISERSPVARPLVIYVNASSEQEARDTMPGVTLIFAARLPFHAFQVMEAAV